MTYYYNSMARFVYSGAALLLFSRGRVVHLAADAGIEIKEDPHPSIQATEIGTSSDHGDTFGIGAVKTIEHEVNANFLTPKSVIGSGQASMSSGDDDLNKKSRILVQDQISSGEGQNRVDSHVIGGQERREGGGNIHPVQSPPSNVLLQSSGTIASTQPEQPNISETEHNSNDTDVQHPTQNNANTVNSGRRDSEFLSLHLKEAYSNPLWQHFVNVFTFAFSGLGGWIAYCQLLDSKAIDQNILFADLELAKELIIRPEVAAPCVDQFQDQCMPQYIYCSAFAAIAVCMMFMGLWESLSACDVTSDIVSKYVPSSNQVQPAGAILPQLSTMDAFIKKISPTMFGMLQEWRGSWLKKSMKEMKAGGSLFWSKSVVMLGVDISLQALKCFYVTGAYAYTNASQMMAQIILMTCHVILCMIAYAVKSEVMSMTINWTFDFLYLMVRLSVAGSIAMRSRDVLDFLSAVMPFVFCIKEIRQVTEFVKNPPRRSAVDESSKHQRTMIALFLSVAAVIPGAIGIYTTYQKGFRQACPQPVNWVSGVPEDYPLPAHMLCELWTFNFYLSPPCSCYYIKIQPSADASEDECSLTEEEVDVVRYIEHVELAEFDYMRPCPRRYPFWENLKFLRAWKPPFEEFPDDFMKLSNLISLLINDAPDLEQIDLDMMNSWPSLESFASYKCSSLNSIDAIGQAELPRLSSVQVYGVDRCPSEADRGFADLDEFRCVSRNDAETCESLPQYLFAEIVDRVRVTKESGCFEPRCEEYFGYYTFSDCNSLNSHYYKTLRQNHIETTQMQGTDDADGLLNEAELAANMWHPTEQYQNLTCLIKHMQDAATWPQNEYYVDAAVDLIGKLTVFDFAAMVTAYTTCAQCDYFQDYIRNPENKDTSCEDSPTFRDALGSGCGDWRGYDCQDLQAVAFWGYSEEDLVDVQKNCPSTCWLCEFFSSEYVTTEDAAASEEENGFEESFIHENEAGDTVCQDIVGFIDAIGSPCSGWIGYDCTDVVMAAYWGYTPGDMEDVKDNCKASCELCESESKTPEAVDESSSTCQDTAGFKDALDYACQGWAGYDCMDVGTAAGWGYTEEDMEDVQENCASTCGLCR